MGLLRSLWWRSEQDISLWSTSLLPLDTLSCLWPRPSLKAWALLACSILKSEQACESTGWIIVSPFTLVLLGPSGRCPFHPGLPPAWTMTHPHHFALYSGCRGLKGAKCVVSFHSKALSTLLPQTGALFCSPLFLHPAPLPLILHRWVRCHFLQEARQVRGAPATPWAAAHFGVTVSKWLPDSGAALVSAHHHCIPLHVSWHKVGFNLICWMN